MMRKITTIQLVILLLILCSSFFCHHVTGVDNFSTRNEDGRRVLAGYASLFKIARAFFKKTPPAYQKLKTAFRKAPVDDMAEQATEFYLQNGQKKNFTQDDAIDYLNCQCKCPLFQLDGSCVQEANYNNCTLQQQQLYCSSFLDNPYPLQCVSCSLIPPNEPSGYDVPSRASPLLHSAYTFLIMICAGLSILNF